MSNKKAQVSHFTLSMAHQQRKQVSGMDDQPPPVSIELSVDEDREHSLQSSDQATHVKRFTITDKLYSSLLSHKKQVFIYTYRK